MYKLPKLNRSYIIVTELGVLISGLIIVGYYFLAISLLFLVSVILIKVPNLFAPIEKNAIAQYFMYSSVFGICGLGINKLLEGNLLIFFLIVVPIMIFKEFQFYKKVWK